MCTMILLETSTIDSTQEKLEDQVKKKLKEKTVSVSEERIKRGTPEDLFSILESKSLKPTFIICYS